MYTCAVIPVNCLPSVTIPPVPLALPLLMIKAIEYGMASSPPKARHDNCYHRYPGVPRSPLRNGLIQCQVSLERDLFLYRQSRRIVYTRCAGKKFYPVHQPGWHFGRIILRK